MKGFLSDTDDQTNKQASEHVSIEVVMATVMGILPNGKLGMLKASHLLVCWGMGPICPGGLGPYGGQPGATGVPTGPSGVPASPIPPDMAIGSGTARL